jgi:hypothetical protein
LTKHYKLTVAFLALFLSAFFSASAANTAPKVVFIGDWITYSWTSAFAANPNWINKGVPESGECCDQPGTSADVLARFQSDVVSLHPAIVHIMVGTADANVVYPSGFQGYIPGFLINLDAMVKEAEAANIKVVLGIGAQNFEFASNVEPINAVIAAYGAVHNIPVINYGDVLCGCVGSTLYLQGYYYSQQLGATGTDANNNPYLTPVSDSTAGMQVPTALGYALMTQMAEEAITAMSYTLKSGYLQNLQYPEQYVGVGDVLYNVNSVAPHSLLQFTPEGVFTDGSLHPMLNSNFAGTTGTWTSSNPLVMYISPKGAAVALSQGTANITYTAPNGVRFSYWTMTVVPPFG